MNTNMNDESMLNTWHPHLQLRVALICDESL